jgi:hypothetical protein
VSGLTRAQPWTNPKNQALSGYSGATTITVVPWSSADAYLRRSTPNRWSAAASSGHRRSMDPSPGFPRRVGSARSYRSGRMPSPGF